ncbi:MAG TPA: TMEM175 family protein, partial [Lacisediminihabitans sp.]|uniref:TMEM175 family protein n=1 Tax=Lacisediminihabitans sp. TaxID=2787631 RepID=UPI002ED8D293
MVNFTDAAVAISITLLVLPLTELSSAIAHEGLGQLFADHWQNVLAFLISFAVIGNLWLVHHRIFELVAAYDAALARLNFLWLAAITVLPFSTNVVASSDTGVSSVYALYIGNMVVASGTGVLLRLYLSRHPVL